MEEVVITSAIRTPIGGFQGELDCFSASDLGGMAIDGAMKQAGIDRVDEVIWGMFWEQAKVKRPHGRQALLQV